MFLLTKINPIFCPIVVTSLYSILFYEIHFMSLSQQLRKDGMLYHGSTAINAMMLPD